MIQKIYSVMRLEGNLNTEFILGLWNEAIGIEFFDSVGGWHDLGYNKVRCAPPKSPTQQIE